MALNHVAFVCINLPSNVLSFIRSLLCSYFTALKIQKIYSSLVTGALPLKRMAVFFLLMKSEWLNMPRGAFKAVHAPSPHGARWCVGSRWGHEAAVEMFRFLIRVLVTGECSVSEIILTCMCNKTALSVCIPCRI